MQMSEAALIWLNFLTYMDPPSHGFIPSFCWVALLQKTTSSADKLFNLIIMQISCMIEKGMPDHN